MFIKIQQEKVHKKREKKGKYTNISDSTWFKSLIFHLFSVMKKNDAQLKKDKMLVNFYVGE